jgi:hypothetical protein
MPAASKWRRASVPASVCHSTHSFAWNPGPFAYYLKRSRSGNQKDPGSLGFARNALYSEFVNFFDMPSLRRRAGTPAPLLTVAFFSGEAGVFRMLTAHKR